MKRNKLFADLGKATQRGVRKCPKCATLNGIRSAFCKNQSCRVSLRNDASFTTYSSSTKRKLKSGFDCVQLVTGSHSSYLYSIRVRDRGGPDYRGFVELPAINGLDASSDPSLDINFIKETAARCLVDCCRRESLPLETTARRESSKTNSLHNVETNITLTIIASCAHVKEAVRCENRALPVPINPAAIDAINIEPSVKSDILCVLNDAQLLESPLVQRVSEANFAIKCALSSSSNKHNCGYLHCTFLNSTRFICSCKQFKSNRDETSRKCMHFYLCIMAFLSHSDLISEFKCFLQQEVPETVLSGQRSFVLSNFNYKEIFFEQKVENENVLNLRKLIDRKVLTENDANVSFTDWLSSVTELINQTMHYQLSGKPDPLVFLVSHKHFDCLQQRISACLQTKGLPSVTTVFNRKDSPPLGTFTKFTYLLVNITHVKQIFDTPKVCLQLTQRFIQTKDGNYEYLNLPESANNYGQAINELCPDISSVHSLIKPVELRTFLKVGLVSPDLKEPIPFVIEWIPDLLPATKVGEMRIQFQFGHRRNGQIEKRE